MNFVVGKENGMRIKFTGDFKDLKPMGFTFHKLFARNYKVYEKDGLWIWVHRGGYVEIDDHYGNSGYIAEMILDDTIAAISTPAGQGGIGIVRISGRDAIKISDKAFRSPTGKKLSQSPSHRILYGHVIDGHKEDIIDEVLVSVMRGPRTYTKEDVFILFDTIFSPRIKA